MSGFRSHEQSVVFGADKLEGHMLVLPPLCLLLLTRSLFIQAYLSTLCMLYGGLDRKPTFLLSPLKPIEENRS